MKSKRFLYLSICLMICFMFLSACDNSQENETPAPTPGDGTTEPAPGPGDGKTEPTPGPGDGTTEPTPGPGEGTEPTEEGFTIEIGDSKITLASYESESLQNCMAAYVANSVSVTANSTIIVKKNDTALTNVKAESGDNNIVTTDSVMTIKSDATSDIYLKLWADNTYTLLITFEPAKTGYYEDFILDDDRKYTGYLVDGVPNGQGTLTWVNTNCVYEGEFRNGVYHGEGAFYWHNHGDSLVGTFESGNPVSGKYTYKNTMSYTGEFNTNWQFHGQGSFDWNTYNADGSVKAYGWLYEGEFRNGSPAGCVGRITFTDARRNPNSEGIHWFEGELDGFPSIKKNQNCKGKIIYGDKSIYEGDLLYTSTGAWLRYGEGIQYFYNTSNYTGATVGGNIDDLLYCYKGQFDSLNHSYIYGNGVMYICDNNLNPVAYIKGCWDGTTRTADWLPQLGEWSDDMLLKGYENVEEIPFVHGYYATLKGLVDRYKDTDLSDKTLIIGASHFTMWYEKAAQDLSPEYNVLNFGIGGSNAYFWDTNLELLEGLKNDPKHIILQINGNISSGDVEGNQAIMQSVMTKLHEMFPTTEIVYMSRFNTVAYFAEYWKVEYTTYSNSIMKEWIETNNIENDKYIDVTHFVYDENATSGDYYTEGYGYMKTNIWLGDKLHLNDEGHKLLAAAIKAAMN